MALPVGSIYDVTELQEGEQQPRLGRSRFDALANELRRPQGRRYSGGDTTENSHSEGAVIAGLRMARQIIERRGELRERVDSPRAAAQ